MQERLPVRKDPLPDLPEVKPVFQKIPAAQILPAVYTLVLLKNLLVMLPEYLQYLSGLKAESLLVIPLEYLQGLPD